jgi:hypothetical protein
MPETPETVMGAVEAESALTTPAELLHLFTETMHRVFPGDCPDLWEDCYACRQRARALIAVLYPDAMPAREVLSRTRVATLQPCGTPAAYARHIKRGEEPCDPCREANNAYARHYRRRRKRKSTGRPS